MFRGSWSLLFDKVLLRPLDDIVDRVFQPRKHGADHATDIAGDPRVEEQRYVPSIRTTNKNRVGAGQRSTMRRGHASLSRLS